MDENNNNNITNFGLHVVSLRFSVELFEEKLLTESSSMALVVYLDKKVKKINKPSQHILSDEDEVIEIGRTEKTQEINPSFAKVIEIDYTYYHPQMIIFRLFRCKFLSNKIETTEKYLIGESSLSLGQLIASETTNTVLNKSNKVTAKLAIQCSLISSNSTGTVYLHFYGENLDNVDILDLSDPFFRIKKRYNHEWINIYCSETINNNLNPHWRPFYIRKTELLTEKSEELMFCVYDRDISNEKLIGEFFFTYNDLCTIKNARWPLINKKKLLSSEKYSDSGTIILNHFDENNKSFIDFIHEGLKINPIFALDFSLSTGLIVHPDSIHSRYIDNSNLCLKPLTLAADFFRDYSDRLKLYGFGGTSSNSKGYIFNLSDNESLSGSDDVISAYSASLSSIEQREPTFLSHVVELAQYDSVKFHNEFLKSKKLFKYTVLIVFTDCIIDDIEETTKKVIEASSLPLSIVIVGLGALKNRDLARMIRLDSDNFSLELGKRKADRDICNFVHFKDDQSKEFIERVMTEIPKQIKEYHLLLFNSKQIK